MAEFKVGDRVAVDRNSTVFHNLRGYKGTVVRVIDETPLSKAMVDVALDKVTNYGCIPFFPEEVVLVEETHPFR